MIGIDQENGKIQVALIAETCVVGDLDVGLVSAFSSTATYEAGTQL